MAIGLSWHHEISPVRFFPDRVEPSHQEVLVSAGADSVTDHQVAPSSFGGNLLVGFANQPFSSQFSRALEDLSIESGLSQDPLADTDPIL